MSFSEPVDPVVGVGDDVSEDGLSLLLVLVAPPPRSLHADVHVGVDEALGPDDVEKHVANCVGELGVGHLEAGAKPEKKSKQLRKILGCEVRSKIHWSPFLVHSWAAKLPNMTVTINPTLGV